MPASRVTTECAALITPVIDCEPAPVGVAACRPPTPKSLRRRTPRPLRPAPAVSEPAPPRTAVVFADAALRRVLEVIDRRRPIAQLRPVLAPALIESVLALSRSTHDCAATLQRVRVRMVAETDSGTAAAEVFGTYRRGARLRAIAARIATDWDRWRIVALQIG